VEPKDFGRVLLRRKATVITAITIVMMAAFFASSRKEPLYVSSCKIAIEAIAYDPTEPNSRPFNNIGGPGDYRQVLLGDDVTSRAAALLDLPLEYVAVRAVDQVQGTDNTFQITIARPAPKIGDDDFERYSADDPDTETDESNPGLRSAEVCNATMQAYVDYNLDQARTWYTKLMRQKEAQRDALAAEVRTYEELIAVEGEARSADLIIQKNGLLQVLGETAQQVAAIRNIIKTGIEGGGRVVQVAGPGAAASTGLGRDLMMGLMIGLMSGIAIAFVREYMDDTVKDKESTQRELGLPVLAGIPAIDDIDGLDEPSTGTIDAARSLRATLASLGFPHEKQMLMITSTLAKRRATTLASLAAAVAESGRSVLVIGSDLRSGRTHEAFGIANTVGLANVVRGQVPFERAIRPAPGIEGVYVMPCGPIIGNPGELLSSEAMAMTLRRARRWADVVLLDAPPVLAAADASILGAYADGVVLVLSAGQTNRQQANEAKEQLIAAGARVLGAVLVGTDETSREHHDDHTLNGFGDWGGYGGMYDQSQFAQPAYDDGWLGEDEVISMTAYTAPRPQRRRTTPPKKISASRPGQAPKRKREPSAPKGGVRTARSNGARKASTTRSKGSSKTSTARKTTARKTTARKTTARKPTTRKTPSKTTTKRTTTRGH
jgi:capsular exopolysaccharide synthesis family protein